MGGDWLRGGHILSAELPLVDALLSYHNLPSFVPDKTIWSGGRCLDVIAETGRG